MANPIRVLTAYQGPVPLFEISRDAALKLTGWDVAAQKEMDAPAEPVRARINRVVFYAQPQTKPEIGAPAANDAVMEFPFIPGTVRLGIVDATPKLRVVDLTDGLIRCFINGLGQTLNLNEVVRLILRLAPAAQDSTGYGRLDIAYANFAFGGWQVALSPPDIRVTRASLAADFRFSMVTDRPSQFTLGLHLGLTNGTVWGTRYHGKLFDSQGVSAYQGAPLQWGFRVTTTQAITFDLSKLGIPAATLLAHLDILQRPRVPVGQWETPDWYLESSLTGATEQILRLYNESVAEPIRRSLLTVRAGQPLSLLPFLKVTDPALQRSAVWVMGFQVRGEWPANEPLSGGQGTRPLNWKKDFTGPQARFAFRIGTLHPEETDPGEALPAAGTFHSFVCEDGNPLTLPLGILNLQEGPHRWVRDFGSALEIEMALHPLASKGALQGVRLGALQLMFAGPVPDAPEPAIEPKEVEPVLRFTLKADPVRGTEPVVSQFELWLPVFAMNPGGQDPLPGEEYAELFQTDSAAEGESAYQAQFRLPPPLVFAPRRPRPAPADAAFRLYVAETALTAQTQTVDLRLSRPQPGPQAEERIWVYHAAERLFVEVRYADFSAALLSAVTNEMANFSTRSGAVWEIAASANGFDLVLPPQGVGEAMEKYRNRGRGLPEDVEEDKVVPFRFTPPAALRVLPSYYRQRFAEPPWNLRRLLGYPGQRDPGMEVEWARFELFYGLAGRIDRTRLRLAEIAARLGAIPGRQPVELPWPGSDVQKKVYKTGRQSWMRWYPVLRSRLAVLEPWRPGQGDNDLVLTDGVSCELRPSARLAFPARLTADGTVLPAEPAVLKPLAPDVPPRTYAEQPDLQLPKEDADRLRSQAPGPPLAGGVAWPFKSLNLYNLLWKRPRADAAELARPYFSMLGGWGTQKATFADGQLRVSSDTTMGRTHSVTLEVLGRISVGWHLAKLIIVYERTVLPARQFVNEDNQEQDDLRGRPTVRKVKEYVEILEPFRRFPDDPSPPRERGCLLGIEFPDGSRRINVTSRWGRDVGTPRSAPDQAEGWKVPLWVRGARPEDVYPRPQIVAVFAPAHGEVPVRAEIVEPEKFYFFTNTKDGRDPDPHRWPAVQGIDYTWFPADAIDAPPAPVSWSKGDLRARPTRNGNGKLEKRYEDFPVRGGLGPFTFALAPGGHPVNVMAERAAPLGTLLRNITLMRGYSHRHVLDVEKPLLELRDHAEAAFAPAREWLGRTGQVLDLDPAEAGGAAEELLKTLQSNAKSIVDRVGELEKVLPSPKTLCPLLQTQVRRVLAPMRAAGNALGDDFARQTLTVVDRAFKAGGLPAAKKTLEETAAKFPEEWKKAIRRFDALTEAADGVLGRGLQEADEAVEGAFERVEEFLYALDELPPAVVEAAAGWNETVRPFREARTALLDVLHHLDDALQQAARPWTADLPNGLRVSLHTTWDGFEKLAHGWEVLLAPLEKVLDDLNQAEYDAAVTALAAALTKARDDLRTEWGKFHGQLLEQQGKLLEKADDVRKKLDEQVEQIWKPIQQQLNGIAALASGDQLLAALGPALTALRNDWGRATLQLEDQAAAVADQACGLVFGPADEYVKYLNSLLDAPRLKDWVGDALGHLPSAAEVRRRFQMLEQDLVRATRGLIERAGAAVGSTLGQLAKPAIAAGDSVLRLVRAFGEAPRVPGLDFRLPDFDTGALTDRLAQIGYYFGKLDVGKLLPLPAVDITPVLAKANELGRDVVNALESVLPTRQLFDRLIPAELANFDLRSIFPNFAGLNLANLFDGLKLPEHANKNVKVTHGADPQSLRGWAQVDVDVPFGGQPITLFTLAGLAVRVKDGRFQATSRIEAAASQSPRQTFRGEVGGDWEVAVGGFVLVVIERTALRFDDGGKVTFEVRPDRVRLPGPMAWLADLISRFQFGDKGTSFKVTPDGVQVVLDLPLPDIQAGAFGMANLRLGFFFELSVARGFVIAAGANVARRDAPFTLTIFILGGAGWFDFRFHFVPATKELAATVTIGIMASASLAFALGPIKGGIYAYFGIVVEYEARSGAAAELRVALVLRFSGQVSLLGIVSVYLEIGLEAQYSTGGGLVGRGYVSVSVKICWCFTLRVRCSVSFTFGKSAGGARRHARGEPYRLGPPSDFPADFLLAVRTREPVPADQNAADAADAESPTPAADRRPLAWERDGWALLDGRASYENLAAEYVGMFD